MAAKDKYHGHVKEALMKDGWTITHDPYVIKFGKDKEKYEVDFGAEKIIALPCLFSILIYNVFSTCSLIFSKSSFILTTIFCISA